MAVIAGYIVMAALTVATVFVLGLFFPEAYSPEAGFPSQGWVILNLFYSTLYAFVGGYVAAWVADSSPMNHALALGVLIVVLGVSTAFSGDVSQAGVAQQPLWYLLALVLLGFPGVLLGGYLRARQEGRK
jgi:hypothetical protein